MMAFTRKSDWEKFERSVALLITIPGREEFLTQYDNMAWNLIKSIGQGDITGTEFTKHEIMSGTLRLGDEGEWREIAVILGAAPDSQVAQLNFSQYMDECDIDLIIIAYNLLLNNTFSKILVKQSDNLYTLEDVETLENDGWVKKIKEIYKKVKKIM